MLSYFNEFKKKPSKLIKNIFCGFIIGASIFPFYLSMCFILFYPSVNISDYVTVGYKITSNDLLAFEDLAFILIEIKKIILTMGFLGMLIGVVNYYLTLTGRKNLKNSSN